MVLAQSQVYVTSIDMSYAENTHCKAVTCVHTISVNNIVFPNQYVHKLFKFC